MSVHVKTLYADPTEIDDTDKAAKTLAKAAEGRTARHSQAQLADGKRR